MRLDRRARIVVVVVAMAAVVASCSSTTGGSGPTGGTSGGSASTPAPSGSSSGSSDVGDCTQVTGTASPPYLNELRCVAAIAGVSFKPEANRDHVEGVIRYDSSPPVGGNHSQYWADCTGTVYPDAIANENAVHALEHGAVWITYRPGLAAADVDALTKLVQGQDRMLMSPYPGLRTKISLQSWGYQLFVDSASDPRIGQFVNALRYNQVATPEYGATCAQPEFKIHPSTYGHPLWVPAD